MPLRAFQNGQQFGDVVEPALRTGLISELVWVVPPWLDEPPRDVVRSIDGGIEFRTRVVPLADIPEIEGEVILDIDLDFFACENPHADHVDAEILRGEYDRLIAEGRVRMRGEARDGDVVTESTVLARPPGPYAWPVRLDRVTDAGSGEERFVKGWICMGLYRDRFPVHRPDGDEVRALARDVKDALDRARIRPTIVTVARSVSSGFVPADRADAIEAMVREALRARR